MLNSHHCPLLSPHTSYCVISTITRHTWAYSGATTNSMKLIWLPARLVLSRSHMGLQRSKGHGNKGRVGRGMQAVQQSVASAAGLSRSHMGLRGEENENAWAGKRETEQLDTRHP